MKKLFSKDNFLFHELDKKQRIQSLTISILLIIFFILSSFTFMNMFYAFVNEAGSIVSGSLDVAIKDLLRSIPLFLSFFMSIWTCLLIHAIYRNASIERFKKSLYKNSIALICFSVVNIGYILIGRGIGKYLSLVEGSPSYLYPLDALLYSILFLVIGICVLIYVVKFKDKYVYIVPSRGPIVTKARFLYCLGVSIWMLFALYSFSAFWMGWFIIDFVHGYLFFSLSLLFVYLVNWVTFVCWELYYNEVKADKRKDVLLPLGIIGTSLSLLSIILYFVSLSTNKDAPANIGFGILPVSFAASINIGIIVTVFIPLIVSVIALVKGILLRKKQ